MTDSPTRLSMADGLATITLARPENKNALSVDLVESLLSQLSDAILDPDVRVIVVTNEGGTFCAGADLKAAGEGRHGSSASLLVTLLETIVDSPIPTVARIDGHCLGGGVGLAAAFDISVARSDAKFGFTEARLGVAPAVISVVCLPKLRAADARELFLRSSRFDATRAAEVGLINHAVGAGALDDTVADVVSDVMAGGPLALAACKQLLAQVPLLDRFEAFEWTEELSTELFGSDEAAEGIAAFLERRPAGWIPDD